MLILAAQSGIMLYLQKGVLMYALEVVLVSFMAAINYKQLNELAELVLGKFLKKKKGGAKE